MSTNNSDVNGGSSNGSDMSQMQERNEQTLTDIQNLQSIEKDLYLDLEKMSAANLLTEENKTKLINKINEISQMRMNLYANLRNSYAFYQNSVITSRHTMDEQGAAVNIVENELNTAKERLKSLQDDQYNKLRYVEINTYYSKRYNDHASIMKIIIFICIPVIILSILANKGIIPSNISGALTIAIVAIGMYFLGSKLIIMSNRDKMNYDQFNWYFDPSAQDKNSKLTTEEIAESIDPSSVAGNDFGADGAGPGGAGNYSIPPEPPHAFKTIPPNTNNIANDNTITAKGSTVENMLSGMSPSIYSMHTILNGDVNENKRIDPQLNNYVVF